MTSPSSTLKIPTSTPTLAKCSVGTLGLAFSSLDTNPGSILKTQHVLIKCDLRSELYFDVLTYEK